MKNFKNLNDIFFIIESSCKRLEKFHPLLLTVHTIAEYNLNKWLVFHQLQ